ncbi:MAG: Type I restriction-modification system, specificity subunit S [Nitrospira sp.]|jgi:type I restriction enzyme S subunit|nr:MAG: Type I restriction-modification system, specificity subunit S [Nitrospira sp.]
MADDWRACKLGEIITLKRGYDLPQQNREPGPFPIVSSSGITDYHVEAKVKGPGVVTGRYGTLGEVFYIRDDFWPLNTSLYVQEFKGNDARFISYFLQQLNFGTRNAAGAVPGVNRNHLHAMDVRVPPLTVQRRIAGILSAYDDLIENNQRRIKILEEMARSLYREWFVHFRFPGHDKMKMVPSALGPIPEGWEVKKLGDVADVNRAQVNPRTAPDEVHYIDISSVSPGQIDNLRTYQFADAPGRARRIVQHSDILWSCVRPNRRSHALVMKPEPNTIASTGFAVLTATKVPCAFLYQATTTDDFVTYLANNATGAAYPAVTAKTFEDATLLVPAEPLLKKFGETTILMAEQIRVLQSQIQNLRRTRDLLLPRLLSGQIDLKSMDAVA